MDKLKDLVKKINQDIADLVAEGYSVRLEDDASFIYPRLVFFKELVL